MSDSFSSHLKDHCRWMQANGYAKATIRKRQLYLLRFFRWCSDNRLQGFADITQGRILNFQKYLSNVKDRKDHSVTVEYQNRHITALKDFFAWLSRNNQILLNPTRGVLLARIPKVLPSLVLTPATAEQIFNQVDIERPLGLRNRAAMEVFYATGIRRSELTDLTLSDINPEEHTVFIRKGKGEKDRVIPISDRALFWLDRYTKEARVFLLAGRQSDLVFINKNGNKIFPESLSTEFNHYFKKAGFEKGSCHVFRHSLATNMLEAGVDTRYIQVMLGHENLVTTQIYTRVTISKLKEVHSQTHPLANS